MRELSQLREKIDSIDAELVRLFEERMEYASIIAEYKMQNGMEVLQKSREEEIISRGLQNLKNKSFQDSLERFLNSLMEISREHQKVTLSAREKCNTVIGFQGIPGSFSEQALFEYFGNLAPTRPVKQFEDLFIELQTNKIEYGVLPIENSSTGAIAEVYDLLNKYDFYITGEICLKIEQNLLGIQGASIKGIQEVYSHPQAFSQCAVFLNHYDAWKLIPYENTAKSAQFVKKQNSKSIAAIGSKRAAEIYGLDIIEENINFSSSNTTRFVIISRELRKDSLNNKISVVFSTDHKVGCLYNVLRCFSENHLNLLKIESRPLPKKPWEYIFYVDIEGNLNDGTVQSAMNEVEDNSRYFKILGNYKKHADNIIQVKDII